jgi:hypothetical protein
MRWKIVLEGTDEFGSAHRSELTIDKYLERLSAGEIGFSVEDGKAIMAHLQQVVVNQQCEAYILASRFCTDCEGFRAHRQVNELGVRKRLNVGHVDFP